MVYAPEVSATANDDTILSTAKDVAEVNPIGTHAITDMIASASSSEVNCLDLNVAINKPSPSNAAITHIVIGVALLVSKCVVTLV